MKRPHDRWAHDGARPVWRPSSAWWWMLALVAEFKLGSDKAPVRLGGLYALERLAQDNPAHRQTIVNVICAYLCMPFSPAAPASKSEPGTTQALEVPAAEVEASTLALGDTEIGRWQQERQVRLTAQRILAEHLRDDRAQDQRSTEPPSQRFWPDIRLDLAGATLIDFIFDGGVTADARFDGATFSGTARFDRATFTFTGTARFDGASFTGSAGFDGATFSGDAQFDGATFNGSARFDGATFSGAPGSTGRPSAAAPDLRKRPSTAQPGSTGRPSATPGSPTRPSATGPISRRRPSAASMAWFSSDHASYHRMLTTPGRRGGVSGRMAAAVTRLPAGTTPVVLDPPGKGCGQVQAVRLRVSAGGTAHAVRCNDKSPGLPVGRGSFRPATCSHSLAGSPRPPRPGSCRGSASAARYAAGQSRAAARPRGAAALRGRYTCLAAIGRRARSWRSRYTSQPIPPRTRPMMMAIVTSALATADAVPGPISTTAAMTARTRPPPGPPPPVVCHVPDPCQVPRLCARRTVGFATIGAQDPGPGIAPALRCCIGTVTQAIS